MKLSQNAHSLLKLVIITTGEKEIVKDKDNKEKEVDSPRRLNREEGAQRRFYLNAIDPIIAEKQERRVKLLNEEVEVWKSTNEKGDMSDDDYNKKLSKEVMEKKEVREGLKEIDEESIEIELTDKTIEVLKKYIKEFGDKNGWMPNDDAVLEEITAEL